MRRFDRRRFLKLSLGAGQLALLGAAGATMFNSRKVWANNHTGPTKLLTIYVPGGWMPVYFFSPLTGQQISSHLPDYKLYGNGSTGREPCFYRDQDLANLDGSGNAMAEGNAAFQRIRCTQYWDTSAIEAKDYNAASNLAINGYAWEYYKLWEKSLIVHGVDQETASHASGRISALSGAAGSSWRSPSLHAWLAHALHDAYGAQRILGAVAVRDAPIPRAFGLSHGDATLMRSIGDLSANFSEQRDDPWKGIRNDRNARVTENVAGNTLALPIDATRLEKRTLDRIKALSKQTDRQADAAFLEQLWSSYASVSTQLASDIVTTLENTVGWRPDAPRPPHWQNDNRKGVHWVTTGQTYLGSSDHWGPDYDLTLRLLKSGLVSAVSLEASGAGDFFFDTHGGGGGDPHETQCVHNRAVLESIGRLLGEMDTTPGVDDPSKTLLDETLVVIKSEFARTWPKSGKCDHHPATSVIFAGGGIQTNRMIGTYDTSTSAPGSLGPMGAPVGLTDKQNNDLTRPPKSADIIHTALHAMGVEEFDIPGGSALIKGVLS